MKAVIHSPFPNFSAMSKVSFRARQIDFNKPLPILKNGSDLLTEFSENALVNRGVPQIPSGMEKEEENVNTIEILCFCDLFFYFVRLCLIAVVLAEDEPTEYDMDTEDEDWLSKSDLGISPEKFESMIDRLERGCGQKVMNLEEAKYLLQDDPSLVIAVYDYWLNKRVQSRQPLLFAIRQERRDGGSNADPYVAFRRRSEKMQTRKNRKNDEQSYEKMLILRDQMDREVVKEALVQCDFRCFQARYKLRDWDGAHLNEAENVSRKAQAPVDAPPARTAKVCPRFVIPLIFHLQSQIRKRPSRKRKLTQRALNLSVRTQSSEDVSDGELGESNTDGPFAFIRTPGCRYLKPRYFNCLRVSIPHPTSSVRLLLDAYPAYGRFICVLVTSISSRPSDIWFQHKSTDLSFWVTAVVHTPISNLFLITFLLYSSQAGFTTSSQLCTQPFTNTYIFCNNQTKSRAFHLAESSALVASGVLTLAMASTHSSRRLFVRNVFDPYKL
ncbi:unnamed protein product [Echinostoma caproni]|uniref:Enhancer of polycomb-like protein n=1 Tax=Echinostoma caproni TaxID=27848 RepID=A0A183AVM6_9TREM|nr:unnamed protein product [Echinostoma caproni]